MSRTTKPMPTRRDRQQTRDPRIAPAARRCILQADLKRDERGGEEDECQNVDGPTLAGSLDRRLPTQQPRDAKRGDDARYDVYAKQPVP